MFSVKRNVISAAILVLIAGCTTKVIVETATEQFRPKFHYTPPANWMNDPNGMVYYEGEYHLFYQYHPNSTVWGPMHWGHAVSTNLLDWQTLPIALYPDEQGTIFSGSAVIDWQNTSGFGSIESPPMVAIYTYHDNIKNGLGKDDFQTQAIAYSLDKGRSWTKFHGNPVLNNPGIRDFRDPKVTWHEPSQRWIMVLAQQDHIGFYSSKNLRQWQPLSTFGEGVGSHGGVWECPDLLRVKIEGTDEYKYILIVSLITGAPNGGSGTQYFVGDFDGERFLLDDEFSKNLQPTPSYFPEGMVFENFENGFENWRIEGNAFSDTPTTGGYEGQNFVDGFVGKKLANSYHLGDGSVGSITSQEFKIRNNFINFYIGGGSDPKRTSVNLLIDDKIVKSQTGSDREVLSIASWDVREYIGQTAQIKIIDNHTGSWGHILADHIVFSDEAAHERIEPAMWLDYGTDNYAGVTFSNIPRSDGRHLFMGWVNNWTYANSLPTKKWRGAMTVPRELSLVKSQHGFRLSSKPASELSAQTTTLLSQPQLVVHQSPLLLANSESLPTAAINHSRLTFNINASQTSQIELRYSNQLKEQLSITLDLKSRQLILDRSQSGITDFNHHFANIQTAPLTDIEATMDIDILYDNSIVEIFVNGGSTVMTVLVFPNQSFDKIEIMSSDEVTMTDLKLHGISK
ncbi:glycoside hydrolase family 32 protein [Aliiglaciecola litoralis]|uniref:Levanase n=1 Tax=Aliiglaciecola litoralis TaxID=582857 RepID=A0ABP3WN99_9ALTE